MPSTMPLIGAARTRRRCLVGPVAAICHRSWPAPWRLAVASAGAAVATALAPAFARSTVARDDPGIDDAHGLDPSQDPGQPPGYVARREPEQADLDPAQSRAFRQWFVAIVVDQIRRAPTPRWVHRDCAGLVRFAAAEALDRHDPRWLQAMGWSRSRPLPPDVDLRADQRVLGRQWRLPDGGHGAYASAIALVQANARRVGRERAEAEAGDLLFFDQGDEQHLMVWTGTSVAYHTGADPTPTDNGLREVRWDSLMRWPDTRWRPSRSNANYAGLYRLHFLT